MQFSHKLLYSILLAGLIIKHHGVDASGLQQQETKEIIKVDTTGFNNCQTFLGKDITLKNSLTAFDCVEALATNSIDLIGDFNTISGNAFNAEVGNIVARINTFAYPKYGEGVVRLNYKGEIQETLLNLFLTYDNKGNTILKDLAFENKLRVENPQLYTKEYLIGYADKYNPAASTFSVEQLKNGINVNAYKGREITITAYMHKNANKWEADNAFQQTIFIPDPNYKHTRQSENITYFYAPPTKIYRESPVHYFDEYISKINLSEGDVFGILATTNKEKVSPTWQSLNIFGASTKDYNKAIFYVGDDFVNFIPADNVRHPLAYEEKADGSLNVEQWVKWFDGALNAAGSMEKFKQNTIEAFQSVITRPFGYKYKVIFVNNELIGFWERSGYKGTLFRTWIKEAYEKHCKETGNLIVAWGESIFKYDKIISDYGFGEPEKIIENTYKDLNFDSQGNFQNFINWDKKSAEMLHSSMLGWGTPMLDVGGYSNNFFNYELTYNYIYMGLFTEKHNIPQKTAYIHWHDVEPTYGEFIQTDKWIKFKDKVYRVPSKQIVGPESMFALGAATAFFTPPGKGGYIAWSDPIAWTSKEEANGIYPYFGLHELTPEKEVLIRNDNATKYFPASPTTYLNQVVDAYYIVKEHKEILENSKVEVADINQNGEWFTGQEKYPYAAAYHKRPFVAYRKYGNEILVFAYAWYNHDITNTKFRTTEGQEFDIEIRGCYPTIAKIKL